VEVEVTRIHAEPLRKLTVRQVLSGARAEHLEDAEPKRMPERFQLLVAIDRENVDELRIGYRRSHRVYIFDLAACCLGGRGRTPLADGTDRVSARL
jgi:hypothetical protein